MPEFSVEVSRLIRGYEWGVVYVTAPTEKEAQLKALEMSDDDIEWQTEITDWGSTIVDETYIQD